MDMKDTEQKERGLELVFFGGWHSVTRPCSKPFFFLCFFLLACLDSSLLLLQIFKDKKRKKKRKE